MKSKSTNYPCYLRVLQSYIVAGHLLHLITVVEVIAAIILVPLVIDLDMGNNIILISLKIYGLIYLIGLPVSAQLDARSRFQNYKQVKDQIFLYGYDERIFNPVLKSRCQRDAAFLSAKELGYGVECKQYFHSKGYRWFHVFPDFVFKKPQFLFTVYFWRTTFFTPRYKPKVNYCALEQQSQRDKSDIILNYNVQ